MFRHSLNIILGFYVIPLRYVVKFIGGSPKGRPKMRQFFNFFYFLNKNNLFFCQCSLQ